MRAGMKEIPKAAGKRDIMTNREDERKDETAQVRDPVARDLRECYAVTVLGTGNYMIL